MTSTFSFPTGEEPFDLELCVTSGQVFRWERTSPTGWRGVDGPYWYRIEETPQGLEIESNGDESTFRKLFDLDTSLLAARDEILRTGPEIEPYLGAFSGLRLMKQTDPVETFFSFLCTPNNNVARITKMVGILAGYGDPFEEVDLRRFPSAVTIAEIPETILRDAKFGYRAATIPKAALALVERGGVDYLNSLRQTDYQTAQDELRSFPGIGRKLADCIALFGLHHTEAVPIDTHLWQASTRLYFPEWEGLPLTEARYIASSERIRNRFGNLAGLVQQHLFFDSLLNWRSRKSN